jgi:HEPN domain-containing protein
MNRADFQKLAKLRIREAKVLLDRKHYEGAYYLAGYAVECALKACIAKKTKRHDFPPKTNYYIHNLAPLVNHAGLSAALEEERKLDTKFESNWGNVKDWTEESRYESDIDEKRASDLYSAITNKEHGVLSWLRKFW